MRWSVSEHRLLVLVLGLTMGAALVVRALRKAERFAATEVAELTGAHRTPPAPPEPLAPAGSPDATPGDRS